MGLPEGVVLVALAVCIASGVSVRVETSQEGGGLEQQQAHGRDSFNPGHTQHGGWRKPEGEGLLEAHQGGNQWTAGDFAGYNPTLAAAQFEGQGSSYRPGPVQLDRYPSVQASDSIKFGSSSSVHGGDLIVGQGSVQRPASAPASGVTFNQVQASYPKKSGQDYVQTLSSGNLKPQHSEYPEYVVQHQSSSSNVRAGTGQPKPALNKYQQQQPAYSQPGPGPAYYSQGAPFPQPGKGHMSPKFPGRPAPPPPKGGVRFPPQGPVFGGPSRPGVAKFPPGKHPASSPPQGPPGLYYPKPFPGPSYSP